MKVRGSREPTLAWGLTTICFRGQPIDQLEKGAGTMKEPWLEPETMKARGSSSDASNNPNRIDHLFEICAHELLLRKEREEVFACC